MNFISLMPLAHGAVLKMTGKAGHGVTGISAEDDTGG